MERLARVRLASGIELDCLDVGPREGPVLIFLHGFPESWRTWRHQIAHLRGRFRCIAPDQRGYGGSSKPGAVADYATGLLVADIFQLADALGVERFAVLGHDWGGVIAGAVGAMGQASGRVTRVVIANAPIPAIFQRLLYTDPAQRAASQYIRVFRDPANDALVRDHGLGAMLLKAFGLTDTSRLGDPAQRDALFARAADPGDRDHLLARWQDRDAAFAMLNWYRASPLVVPPMDAPFVLPEGWSAAQVTLTLPALVIWGMRDTALLPANINGLDALASDLTIIRVPESGHFVAWEAPDTVNAALDGFLAAP